jgi:hypothetical protein
MYNSGFDFTFQEFAARGYVLLYTNPRGSNGYGRILPMPFGIVTLAPKIMQT